MSDGTSRDLSWIATRKGKAILAGGIITTIVISIIITPLVIAGLITFMNAGKLHARQGDTVSMTYVGKYASNGTVFDSGTLIDVVIGSNDLLSYFDQSLVGMEPGIQTTFVIPSEYGYTNPGNLLYGHDLQFEVTITKLTRDGLRLYP